MLNPVKNCNHCHGKGYTTIGPSSLVRSETRFACICMYPTWPVVNYEQYISKIPYHRPYTRKV